MWPCAWNSPSKRMTFRYLGILDSSLPLIMLSMLALGLLSVFLFGSIYISFFFTVRRDRRHLPPGKYNLAGCFGCVRLTFLGPPTLPIIGNLHQYPKSEAHFQYDETLHALGIFLCLLTRLIQIHKMGKGIWSHCFSQTWFYNRDCNQ